MDISFSPEHETFREEVRTFLDDALTDELREAQLFCPGIFLDYEHNIRWHKTLHAKGWVAPSWPEEYGGTGWDLTRRYIWSTETTLAGAPSLAPMGLGMCGPMLIGYGSEEQKNHYLPRILSGVDYWCQGYSEPPTRVRTPVWPSSTSSPAARGASSGSISIVQTSAPHSASTAAW